MHTLKLRVNDKVYDKLIQLLNSFNKDEIEIIPDSSVFDKNQEYLTRELKDIEEENATFLEMDEVEQRLENTILKNENNI